MASYPQRSLDANDVKKQAAFSHFSHFNAHINAPTDQSREKK